MRDRRLARCTGPWTWAGPSLSARSPTPTESKRLAEKAFDATVGGTYRMSFTNFTTGRSHAFGGTYLELVPHERIRHTDAFDDPNLPGKMQTTITLKAVSCGTELDIVQAGLPAVIPPDACCLGWQESLML